MNKHQPTRKILLVEDHPIVRLGIKYLVESHPQLEICPESGTGWDCLDLIEKFHPDLVILDISLPQSNGLEIVEHLTRNYPDLPTLVFSMHDEKMYAERALRAGARGYLVKQEDRDKIVAAIFEVLAGKVFLSAVVKEQMLSRLIHNQEIDIDPISSLSNRELEILQLLGQGLNTREIAEKLHLSRNTIDTYRANLKTKLNLKNSNELLHYAFQWVRDQS